MPDSLATEADIILAGYRTGYYSIEDVIAWADRWILALDEPPTALLDLSMGRELYDVDFTNLLRSLGTHEGTVVSDVVLGMIGAGVFSGRIHLESAACQLHRLTLDDDIELTPEQRSTIYQLDHAYDLAVAGEYGTLEQVESRLREFLGPYADRLKRDGLLPK